MDMKLNFGVWPSVIPWLCDCPPIYPQPDTGWAKKIMDLIVQKSLFLVLLTKNTNLSVLWSVCLKIALQFTI